MSISKVNVPGWGVGDQFTSTQANAFDTKIITALDKTSAGDTLSGAITLSTAGRIIPSVAVGADADTTYTVGTVTTLRVTSAATASRIYTLSASGAATNDVITIYCESSFNYAITVRDQAASTMYTIGNVTNTNAACDGPWASFIYIGGWRLLHSAPTRSAFQTEAFTGNGTFTVPYGVSQVMLIGCGAGGGGGGAGTYSPGTNNQTDTWNFGGAGGGGALLGHALVSVTPGGSYAVVIGTGGSGGAINTGGSDGTDTTFGAIATFAGAGGGYGAATAYATSSAAIKALTGGSHVRGSSSVPIISQANSGYFAQSGGAGVPTFIPTLTNASLTGAGGRNPVGGYAGGSKGADGTDSGTSRGGGGGGGGGAGPYGVGAAGGAGGNGNAGGIGVAGVVGGTASANTGAGGGGGGAAGHGTSGAASAAGGVGASGHLTVVWVK